MYQEDYQSLISASEAGIRISYSPTNIESLINDFKADLKATYFLVRE